MLLTGTYVKHVFQNYPEVWGLGLSLQTCSVHTNLRSLPFDVITDKSTFGWNYINHLWCNGSVAEWSKALVLGTSL